MVQCSAQSLAQYLTPYDSNCANHVAASLEQTKHLKRQI